jgi:hypothetical protein
LRTSFPRSSVPDLRQARNLKRQRRAPYLYVLHTHGSVRRAQKAAAAGDITWKTPQQGAATTLVAAVAPEFATTGGHYLDDGNEAPVIANDADTRLMPQGVRAWAVDPDTARRLWDISLDLTGGVRR